MNQPDLVLFVGEALVGNEAVDQLVKFNQALIDNSAAWNNGGGVRTIDGIVLTKFDTIDDKVKPSLLHIFILILIQSLGWSSHNYDLYFRSTDYFCWHGTNLF